MQCGEVQCVTRDYGSIWYMWQGCAQSGDATFEKRITNPVSGKLVKGGDAEADQVVESDIAGRWMTKGIISPHGLQGRIPVSHGNSI